MRPFHEKPGFWYLYEIAFGTNPKYFRNPKVMMEGSLSPERMVSGVVHWGLGIRVWHDPDAPTESQQWREFTAKHNVPADHGFHTHTYFTTYRVHLRAADTFGIAGDPAEAGLSRTHAEQAAAGNPTLLERVRAARP